MYTVIAVCSLMNFYYFEWNSVGNVINSLFCILFAVIIVALPVFYSIFYFKNFDRFLAREPELINRYGTLV